MKIAPLVMARTHNLYNNKQSNCQQIKVGFGSGFNHVPVSIEPLSKQGQELLNSLIAAIPKVENKEKASIMSFNKFLMTNKEIKRRYPIIDTEGSKIKPGPALSVGNVHFYDGDKGFFDYGVMAKSDEGIEQIYVKDNQVFTYTPMQNLNKKFSEYANIILGNK